MTTNNSPVNPLFASQPPSNSANASSVGSGRHRVAKFGGYGGVAVTAWLFTAVATGYGVSAADTPSPSSTQDSPSAGADPDAAGGSTGASDSGTTQRHRGLSGLESALTGARSRSRDNAAADAGSPTTNPASTATVSTSVLGHRLQLPDLRHVVDQLTHVSQDSTAVATTSPTDAAGAQTPSSEPTSSVVNTSTETAGRRTAQTLGSIESKLRSTVTVATASAQSVVPSVERAISGVTHAAPIASATESVVQALANTNGTTNSVTPTAALPTAALTAPVSQLASTGPLGFLNHIVTNLLNPFLHPAPNTPGPVVPIAWAVLGWVRRNLFDQAPTFNQPVTSVQTGQTVTGSLGATDPENDPLTYTVTDATQTGASTWKTAKGGTVTIDQSTGNYTYTPNHIDYDAAQTDSFTVSVTDGNKVNLLGLSQPRTVQREVDVTVLSPAVDRVILQMPGFVKNPVNPRYSEDGKTIYFSGTPTAGGRAEIYQIDDTDTTGSSVKCLTCGATTVDQSSLNSNLEKPVPFTDGSGRILVLINKQTGPTYSVFEPAGYNGATAARIVPIVTPDGGGANPPPGQLAGIFPTGVVDRQREMRVSPDGDHVLFTRIVVGQTGNFQAIPIVGDLKVNPANPNQYVVDNAVVVWPTGEGKQWTPDGKGVIIQGGAVDAGNIDDIVVDVSGTTGEALYPGDTTFKGTRLTGNRDYDEDIDMSPNGQWIAVGSTRGFDALTAMTQIQRENFLPVYLAGVYTQYADGQQRNVSNQTWAVAIADDLNDENGIPLFVQDDPSTPNVDEGDGWAARSMPSWNDDGTAVTFWESGNADEHGIPVTQSRLVVANLKYTTSTGAPLTEQQKQTVFNPGAFKPLSTYVAKTTPLPPAQTYAGPGGGEAKVVDAFNSTTFKTTRTVTYTNYVNEDGLILNGTESATYGPDQNSSTYSADIAVTDTTGANRGYLHANNVAVQTFPTQTVGSGTDGRGIESSLDGNLQHIPDPQKAEDAKQGA